jgi:hypothetical protein
MWPSLRSGPRSLTPVVRPASPMRHHFQSKPAPPSLRVGHVLRARNSSDSKIGRSSTCLVRWARGRSRLSTAALPHLQLLLHDPIATHRIIDELCRPGPDESDPSLPCSLCASIGRCDHSAICRGCTTASSRRASSRAEQIGVRTGSVLTAALFAARKAAVDSSSVVCRSCASKPSHVRATPSRQRRSPGGSLIPRCLDSSAQDGGRGAVGNAWPTCVRSRRGATCAGRARASQCESPTSVNAHGLRPPSRSQGRN